MKKVNLWFPMIPDKYEFLLFRPLCHLDQHTWRVGGLSN